MAKEVRFFDINYDRGLGWYRARFPTRAHGRALKRTKGIDMVVGEASPDYLFYPAAPARVARDLPWVKLVVLLRDPVERAWSHYWHQAKRGFEELSFDDAIDREEDRLRGETDRMLRDERYRSYEWHHHSYVARGRYAEQLRRWMDLFPSDGFLIEGSEDLFAAPQATCERAMAFLGLAPTDLGPYEVFNAFSEGQMTPEARSRLQAYYRPHNERLYELLGRDLGWQR